MRTLIYLEGPQEAKKSDFLEENEIPEIDASDLSMLCPLSFKVRLPYTTYCQEIIGITSNYAHMFVKISERVPSEFLILRLRVPETGVVNKLNFYNSLASLIEKLRK